MSRPNIDTFGGYGSFVDCRSEQTAILAARIFFIFVSSLGLPKITARVGSSSSTGEKKAVRRHGVPSLRVYSS